MPKTVIPSLSGSAAPSAAEQEMLELLNRARMDPQGEYAALITNASTLTGATSDITVALRYFGVDPALFRSQLASYDAVAPLAWNTVLSQTATAHSNAMIAADTQSHQVSGEASLGTRIPAAGYTNWKLLAENIFAYSESPVYGHAGFFIDWGNGPGGMQSPAGHRENIMDGALTEVGIAVVAESNAATKVGPYVVTQDFGARFDYKAQLVGVVFDDGDGDRFYDAGEGMGGVTVTATGSAGTYVTTTWAAGGYQMELAKGSYTVTFSGGGLDGTVTGKVTIGNANVKLDALADDAKAAAGGSTGSSGLVGTAGNNVLTGGAGNDVLIGNGGHDKLTGNAGNDLLFAETRHTGFDATAAQVYRLYEATLGRAPNEAGLTAWTAQLTSGAATMAQVATGFIGSPEFQTRYGHADNDTFVTLLYENVLGRSPAASGLAGWTGFLDNGGTRAEVVLSFVASAEFINATAAAAHAFSYAGLQASWSDDVYRLYGATLGREPNAAGLDGWTAQLAGGKSLAQVASGLIGSTEFQTRYGHTDNDTFVTLLYQNVLGRSPAASGLAGWTDFLDNGGSRTQVVLKLAQSAENVNATAASLKSFMLDLGTDDRLDGGKGNDVLFGGMGSDRFIFRSTDTGTDHVAGLEAWDRIELDGFGYTRAAQALNHIHQDGADAVFQDHGVTIVFEDTAASHITADMFILG